MQTISDFTNLILGFVPIVSILALVATALFAAIKLSPSFAERFDAFFDMIDGVAPDQEDEYTNYLPSPRN